MAHLHAFNVMLVLFNNPLVTHHANYALPVGGSFVLNGIKNKLAQRSIERQTRNMLNPDPGKYPPPLH